MKILVISTFEPSRRLAGWNYVEPILTYFRTFGKVRLWFSLLNVSDDYSNSESNKTFIKVNRNKAMLKLKSLSKNSYIVHARFPESVISLNDTIRNFQPDVVIFSNLSAASYLREIEKMFKKRIIKILIQHNVEYLVTDEISRYGRNMLQKVYSFLQKRSVRNFEQEVLSKVDYIISVSQNDVEYFTKNYGIQKEKINLIRPVFEYRKQLYSDQNHERKSISFIGAMDWYPNVNGAKFFVNRVMPELIRKYRDIKFYILCS
jgi:hypothetical protein